VARSRGLPVVIYRPGRITGHSQTGAWRSDDIFYQIIRGCIQLGSSPIFAPEDTLEMTPVDYVSRSIVALSRRRTSTGQAFHLFNPLTANVNDLISWLDRAGYPIQRLEYAAWLKTLERSMTNGQENPLTPMLSLFPDADQVGKQEKKREPRKVMYEQGHTMAALNASAIACPPADESLLRTYLSYMVRTGSLQAPNVYM
jgi:thioester reductase-like protein